MHFITLYIHNNSFIWCKNKSIITSSLRLFYVINDWNKTYKKKKKRFFLLDSPNRLSSELWALSSELWAVSSGWGREGKSVGSFIYTPSRHVSQCFIQAHVSSIIIIALIDYSLKVTLICLKLLKLRSFMVSTHRVPHFTITPLLYLWKYGEPFISF